MPLTNSFPQEDSRPIILPHEYIQPIELAPLKNIHKLKFNHKLYTLIDNSNHEFPAFTEEVKIIRGLELLWSLLCIKNIIRMLVKLLETTDIIKTHFPMDFP